MKLCWNSMLVLSIALAVLPQAPAASAVIREPYEGPALLAYGGLADCADPIRSIGIACVELPKGASKMDLRVLDESGLAVGGTYYLSDAGGAFAGSGTFCEAKSIPVTGVAIAVIRLEAINGPLACVDGGEAFAGPATQGVIAARLR